MTIPYIVTKKLQAGLTPGKFLKEWMSIKDHYLEAKNTLLISVLDSMKRRDAFFLQNNIFLAAVYADLRYRILLSPEKEQRGSEAFSKLFCHLDRTSGDVEQESRSVPDNGNSDDDEFEQKLNIIAARSQNLQFTEPLNMVSSAFKKWIAWKGWAARLFDMILNYPEGVQHAARVLTALPVTQVSVERLFSALKIILSDAR